MLRLAACILVLALAPTAAAAAKPPDPCTLVTAALVSKAIGYHVQAHTRGGNGRAPSCTWNGPPMGYSGSSATLMLQAYLVSHASFESSTRRFAPLSGVKDAYLTMNGAIVVAWRDGVSLFFSFAEAQMSPKNTLALVKGALGRVAIR